MVCKATNVGAEGSHPAEVITQDENHRFVTDAQIAQWDAAATDPAKYMAFAYRRTASVPATPSGGTFFNPIPDGGQWSQSPLPGDDPLFVTSRLFTNTGGSPQQPTWSAPALLVINGSPGDTGNVGATGSKGDPGLNGTNGINGTNGQDGVDGTGITWLGEFNIPGGHPVGATDGQSYRNVADSPPTSYIYWDGTWYQMTVDGTDGQDGTNTAVVSLYAKNTSSVTPPSAFSGTFTYTFSTGVLSGGTPNGWSQTMPSAAPGDFIWVRQAAAVDPSNTDTIAATEFSTAVVIAGTGTSGTNGADGTSVVLLGSVATTGNLPAGATAGDLYVVLADGHGYVSDGAEGWTDVGAIQGPAGDDGLSVYITYHDDPIGGSAPTLPTNAAGNNNGWHTTPTSACNWMTVKIDDGTGTSWGAAIQIAGAEGADGLNTAVVYIYQTTANNTVPPTKPSGTLTYTFATNVLSGGTMNSWTQAIPDVPAGYYLWISQAVASNTSTGDTIDGSEFSTGRVISSTGVDGLSIVWHGEASAPDPSWEVLNHVYKDTDDGKAYIYNGVAWELMVKDGNDGAAGAAGQGQVKAVSFFRSASQPATPTGGSFSNPTADGWSDGIPSGTLPVWMTTRIFTSNAAAPQQAVWGTPQKVSMFGEGSRIQFSTNAVDWHDTPATDDQYMRSGTSVDGGATWNYDGAVLIKGEAGLSVYITYHDGDPEGAPPAAPTNVDGNNNGWHTNATADSNWISQKIDDGTTTDWGAAILIKGTPGDAGIPGVRGSHNFNIDESGAGTTFIDPATAASFASTLTTTSARNVARDIINAFSSDGYIRPNDMITITDLSAEKAGTRVYIGASTNNYTLVDENDFSSLVVQTIDGSLVVNGTVSADAFASDFVSAGKIVSDFLEVTDANISGTIQSTLLYNSNPAWELNKNGHLIIRGVTGDTIFQSGGTIDFANVSGATKPQPNATVGATWGTDLNNVPTFGHTAYSPMPGNICTDPDIVLTNTSQDSTYWMLSADVLLSPTGGFNGSPALSMEPFSSGTYTELKVHANGATAYIPVKDGDVTYFAARMKKTAAFNGTEANFSVWKYDKDDAVLGIDIQNIVGQLAVADTWYTVVGTIPIDEANIAKAAFGMRNNNTAGQLFIDSMYISQSPVEILNENLTPEDIRTGAAWELLPASGADVTADNQFAPSLLWNFDNSEENFTFINATQTTNTAWLGLVGSAADPAIRTPDNLGIIGAANTVIRIRLRNNNQAEPWEGQVLYTTEGGHGEDAGYRQQIPEPAGWHTGDWFTIETDMTTLTAGLTDWVDSIINLVRFDFGNSATMDVDVDWIAIGRYIPSAVYSADSTRDQLSALTSITQGGLEVLDTVNDKSVIISPGELIFYKSGQPYKALRRIESGEGSTGVRVDFPGVAFEAPPRVIVSPNSMPFYMVSQQDYDQELVLYPDDIDETGFTPRADLVRTGTGQQVDGGAVAVETPTSQPSWIGIGSAPLYVGDKATAITSRTDVTKIKINWACHFKVEYWQTESIFLHYGDLKFKLEYSTNNSTWYPISGYNPKLLNNVPMSSSVTITTTPGLRYYIRITLTYLNADIHKPTEDCQITCKITSLVCTTTGQPAIGSGDVYWWALGE